MKKIFWTMCMLGAYMAHAQVVDSTKNIDSTQQDNFVIDYANAKHLN